MATDAQINANRQNSRKSTGPRTEAGRNRSRFNAVKHGFRAEKAILPDEDPAALQERLDRLDSGLAATQLGRTVPRGSRRAAVVAARPGHCVPRMRERPLRLSRAGSKRPNSERRRSSKLASGCSGTIAARSTFTHTGRFER